MKKTIKNNIFGFILGAIIFGSIGSVVAYNYNAKDIEYTPSDTSWNVKTVEDAIKSLKNGNIDFNNLHSQKDIKAGSRAYRTASVTLQPGKYIIYATKNIGSAYTATDNRLTEVLNWGIKNNIDSDSDCRLIDRYSFAGNSKNLVNTQKEYTDICVVSYYCSIDTNRTYTVDTDDMVDDYGVSIINIQAIKLK